MYTAKEAEETKAAEAAETSVLVVDCCSMLWPRRHTLQTLETGARCIIEKVAPVTEGAVPVASNEMASPDRPRAW